jgi:hypothetical protein
MTTEWRTKVHEIIGESIENLLIIKEKSRGINKARADFIECFIFAMISSKSVQFGEIARDMDTDVEDSSNLRRIQRFFSEYDLDYEWVATFILLLLPKEGKVTLCIDGTKWEFGDQKHHILVVTMYSHGVGIPLWFEYLDNKGGASNADEKEYMLLKCIELLGKRRIRNIIGDTEFAGQKLIAFLMNEGVKFYFDVKENSYFIYRGHQYRVKEYMQTKMRKALDGVSIFGQQLSIAMKTKPKRPNGKGKASLIIVTNTRAVEALNVYQNRWSIEVMFQSFKSRGFNLDKTHLKDGERLRKLFALSSIAFVLTFVTGLALNEKKKIPIKSHGYKANSIFRYGLNFIHKALKIMYKKNIKDRIKEEMDFILEWIDHLVTKNSRYFSKNVM